MQLAVCDKWILPQTSVNHPPSSHCKAATPQQPPTHSGNLHRLLQLSIVYIITGIWDVALIPIVKNKRASHGFSRFMEYVLTDEQVPPVKSAPAAQLCFYFPGTWCYRSWFLSCLGDSGALISQARCAAECDLASELLSNDSEITSSRDGWGNACGGSLKSTALALMIAKESLLPLKLLIIFDIFVNVCYVTQYWCNLQPIHESFYDVRFGLFLVKTMKSQVHPLDSVSFTLWFPTNCQSQFLSVGADDWL